ncbi:MAG: response regulator transcription factor [Chloroflexota bacterium]|nr:response regulator transcription factor [Chloroflexota bacterium]
MSGPRVLVVDDEPQLRRALKRSLEGHGYVVEEAEDGAGGLAAVRRCKPDLLLLDLVLPDMSGVDVCRELRRDSDTPIIVLSVLGDEATKVAALDEGADDYLTKPFGADELLARLRVALRHGSASGTPQPAIVSGDLEIDVERRSVSIAGRAVHLTPTEYRVLTHLAMHAGKVLTHPMILRAVWGDAYVDDRHVLRTYINQLRAKLGDDHAAPRFIETEPGVGYRFLTPDAES